MLLLNHHPDYRAILDVADADTLSVEAAREVERFLGHREGHKETPLLSLAALAGEIGVNSVHLKDEGHRLGLGSFKALGGSYAVIRLVLEEATRRLGREVDVSELQTLEVKAVARQMTVSCATDGNHGRSVAQGAQLVGAKCAIFVHSGVSDERIRAIARFGAQIIQVNGNYDDSVVEASRVAAGNGWITVSDTSWPGYERIPGLVMQGYTALVSEALRQLPRAPTHVFVQSGVGGIAAAVAGHLSVLLGRDRPFFTVVDPARAACLFESARAGRALKIDHGQSTVMAMLECYEPSLVAWRILSRAADAFMTVEDEDAISVMRRLAMPRGADPAVVSGESGGVGLAGLLKVASDQPLRDKVGLGRDARILLINTEAATDARRYEEIVGMPPAQVSLTSTLPD
ncbi:diaminopropionate ammonia-lyase [Bradyrhizobium canariense]|uniref:Diaminopropionate ammonia-lyase n=1 Tax=Bradyrhizobium canariense TaxID=255045 RepID=A0A1X3H3V8_9BRAD|nr:diaminopropionate ammonia-lyase [Bradyrhizobium canariense]OSI68639.1 diaminopropionate ammonia-lyase [Bradyrhizobium canariense]OSI78087.1 diaminopropionate ammonia-lyase [Bradyrhizobium canariense]OSI89317.1 diaminopropionate ammonia-lyase [Bradyrhizobium canariense]OSI93146.1 diaminopropionate ammonia-lyase [Bradyrhizobium canariense]OSJ03116.1 diaminopropionate ammonia-lyase [Bradyrhizobium canariense]